MSQKNISQSFLEFCGADGFLDQFLPSAVFVVVRGPFARHGAPGLVQFAHGRSDAGGLYVCQ